MRTEAALKRDKELMRERRRRLQIRDTQHDMLPRIRKLIEAGMTHAEIAQVVKRDRSRVSQIMRAVKAHAGASITALTRFSDLEGA